VTFGGKWQAIFGAIWPGRLMHDSACRRQPSGSHDADDERFACCLDDFLGHDREVVDVEDALDLGDQAGGEADAQIAAEFGVTRPTIYRHLSPATAATARQAVH